MAVTWNFWVLLSLVVFCSIDAASMHKLHKREILSSGFLASPGYPHRNYPSNSNQTFTIQTDPTRACLVTISYTADIEYVSGCVYDRLVLNEGKPDQRIVCGNTNGHSAVYTTTVTDGSGVRISFHSDTTQQAGGYGLEYKVEPIGPALYTEGNSAAPSGRSLGNTPQDSGSHYREQWGDKGTFTSPNYPNNYPGNFDGDYVAHLTKPGPQTVRVYYKHDIEFQKNCLFDYLEFSNTQKRVCGNAQGSVDIPVRGDTLNLRFHSDNNSHLKGFEVDYEVLNDVPNILSRTAALLSYASSGDVEPDQPSAERSVTPEEGAAAGLPTVCDDTKVEGPESSHFRPGMTDSSTTTAFSFPARSTLDSWHFTEQPDPSPSNEPGYHTTTPFYPSNQPDYYTTSNNYYTSAYRPYEYTSDRPYYHTAETPYEYTSDRHYYHTTDSSYQYTPDRPYYHTTDTPYEYTSDRPYYHTTDSSYQYTSDTPYYYNSDSPYQYTSDRHYYHTTDSSYQYTPDRPYYHTTDTPYEYTSDRPYYHTTDSSYQYTSDTPYYYNSDSPYQYTSDRPYYHTTDSSYRYTSDTPYYYNSDRPYQYTPATPYYYTSDTPYQYTPDRPFLYTSDRPHYYTSDRPYQYTSDTPYQYTSDRPTYYPFTQPLYCPSSQPTHQPSDQTTYKSSEETTMPYSSREPWYHTSGSTAYPASHEYTGYTTDQPTSPSPSYETTSYRISQSTYYPSYESTYYPTDRSSDDSIFHTTTQPPADNTASQTIYFTSGEPTQHPTFYSFDQSTYRTTGRPTADFATTQNAFDPSSGSSRYPTSEPVPEDSANHNVLNYFASLFHLVADGDSAPMHSRSGHHYRANVTGNSGYLTSTNYPDPYPNYEDYELTVALGQAGPQTVSLNLVDFDMEWNANCAYDYVYVIVNGDVRNKLCGQRSGETIQVTVPNYTFTLLFHSDGSEQGRGFKIYYTTER